MIKTEKGQTTIHGTVMELMSDLAIIIKHLKETLTENYSEEFARNQIAEAGRLAFMTDNEVDKETEELEQKIGRLIK